MSIWTSTQGTGTDIVVIHGWGMNANVWQTLLPELTSQFRVTQIDLPGFGDSHSLTLSPSLEAICHDILPSLPQQFHVLGWSLGGLVATQLAVDISVLEQEGHMISPRKVSNVIEEFLSGH